MVQVSVFHLPKYKSDEPTLWTRLNLDCGWEGESLFGASVVLTFVSIFAARSEQAMRNANITHILSVIDVSMTPREGFVCRHINIDDDESEVCVTTSSVCVDSHFEDSI